MSKPQEPVANTDPTHVTATLAAFALAPVDLPNDVQAAGVRSLVNIVGCVLGGVHHPASELAYQVNRETAGAPVANLMGRGEKTDVLSAAYLNCLASSANAFDDTHLSTVVHPAGPVMGAVLALVERAGARGEVISGQAMLEAFTLGIEIQCRLGVALLVEPAEGQLGWYSTGIAAGVSAAAASARLLGLSEEQSRWALGIAANQASGFRQSHGSMCTGFVPAHAARCGLQAALLAQHGFTSSDAALEGANGYFDVFALRANPAAAIADLNTTWHIRENAFKPYPCGIVIHPALDACLELARERRFEAADVKQVLVEVNPLCLRLCDRPAPTGNQDAQVSVQHWAAAALGQGRAGLAEVTDACVHDPAVAALRAKVATQANPAIARDGAIVVIDLADGGRLETQIEGCIGSADQPMTDAQLTDKFLNQATPLLGAERARSLLARFWAIDAEPSASELIAASGAPENSAAG